MTIVQGDVGAKDVHKAILKLKEKNTMQFAPWKPSSMQINVARRSPCLEDGDTQGGRISGLMLANHTSVAQLFKSTIDQYDRLRKRNAFLEQYRKLDMFKDGLEEFDVSRESLLDVTEEYLACEQADYLSKMKV